MKGTYTITRSSVGDAPMCKSCPHFNECNRQHMACEQFERWQAVGGNAWKKLRREPSRGIYNRIFNQRKAA